MDSFFHSLRAGHWGTEKSADPFSKDEEIQLWTLVGVMGIDTPLALFRAFFYNGKKMC